MFMIDFLSVKMQQKLIANSNKFFFFIQKLISVNLVNNLADLNITPIQASQQINV